MGNSGMIKSITTDFLMPTSRDLVLQELCDIISTTIQQSEAFQAEYVRTDKQQMLRDLIRECAIPVGEVLYVLNYGSTGSGKSTGVFGEVTDLMLEHPGLKVLFTRQTYVEIEDSIWPAYQEFLSEYGVDYVAKKGEYTIYLKNGSSARFRSSERTSRSKGNKAHGLGSTEYKVVVMEEVDEQPEEVFDTLASRMRQQIPSMRHGLIFCVCNPPSKEHWVHEFFMQDPDNHPDDPQSYKRALQWHVEDNREHVGEGYIRQLYKRYKDDPFLMEAFVRGNFAPNFKGDPIFHRHWKSDFHIAGEDLAPRWDVDRPIAITVDFGFRTPAILVGQDFKDIGQVRVYREFIGKRVLLKPFLERVLRECDQLFPGAKYEFYCDPAGEQADAQGKTDKNAVDIMREMGCPPRCRRTRISYGLNIIQNLLSMIMGSKYGPIPGLVIDPSCLVLCAAFAIGYCNEKDATRGSLKPVKDGRFDHPIDALRYWLIWIRKAGRGIRGLEETTHNEQWTPVADGDPDNWNKDFKRMKNQRQFATNSTSSGRRMQGLTSPNSTRSSLW